MAASRGGGARKGGAKLTSQSKQVQAGTKAAQPTPVDARAVMTKRVILQADGPLKPEVVLERLATGRDEIIKNSNRFLLAALAFSALYGIKYLGLRLDLLVFDYKVFQTPYGMAVFAFCANIALVVALARYMDALYYDRLLRATCDKHCSGNGKFLYETYAQSQAWLGPTYSHLMSLNAGGVKTPSAGTIMTLTGLLMVCIYLVPAACGIHFLYNFSSLADKLGRNFQFYSVLVGVAGSLGFAFSALSLIVKDAD